jgi:hypothetical protein
MSEKKTQEVKKISPEGAAPVMKMTDDEEEEHWVVRFNERSNIYDKKDVDLCCNGEVLQFQRNKEVVVPQRFLEVADHTKREEYDQDDDFTKDQRLIVTYVTMYPYNKVKKSTKAEYLAQKKSGDKLQRESITKSKRV